MINNEDIFDKIPSEINLYSPEILDNFLLKQNNLIEKKFNLKSNDSITNEKIPLLIDALKLSKGKIIPNELAATAYLAIALKRPSDARSRKYKIWSDYYDSIFKSIHVEMFIVNHLIKQRASKYINNSNLTNSPDDIKRYIAKNGQFHIARMTSFMYRKSDNWTDVELLKTQLLEIESSADFLDRYTQQGFEAIIEILNNKETFFSNLLTKSFFENEKLIIINRATDKIKELVEEIIKKNPKEVTLIVN